VGQIHYYDSRAPEEIQDALEPFGFYEPAVEQELTEKNGRWRAMYVIDPGPPLPVDSVTISFTGPGAEDEAFQTLREDFPIQPGEALNHALYEQGKAGIAAVAYEKGYLDGKFKKNQIKIDLERYTSRIDVHYETGPRYLYGPVRLEQDVLHPQYVEGYVTIKEGDPINFTELRQFQASLRASPYFGRVEVNPQKNEADSLEVPIDVVLHPSKKIHFEFGVGVGTDDGLRLSAAAGWRRLNRKGHRADISFKISQIDRRILANYHIPLPYKPTSIWTISAGYTEEDTDTRQSNIALTGFSFAHLRGLWQETLSLAGRWEEYITGVDSGQAVYTGPEFAWTKVKADDRIYVSKGFRLRFRVEGAVKPVLSDVSYLRLFSEGKGIWSLGKRHRLIGRAELGYTLVDNFRELPASRRFYAGGAQSIRGYDFESLGPLDERGNVIGGPLILIGNAEYEFRLLKQWRLAVFYDWGNALKELDDPRAEGAGFGIRWVSPVGMVRGDLAWAVSREGTPKQFHLVIGPDL
jgi:translocation and assembly module TamA